MATGITVEVLPAERGDSLLVTCHRAGGRPWRLLVDGGMPGAWSPLRDRLLDLPAEERQIDLAVVSHIDSDHIGGMLPLFGPDGPDVRFGDVWFNALVHLPEPVTGLTRSVTEGESLGRTLSGEAP